MGKVILNVERRLFALNRVTEYIIVTAYSLYDAAVHSTTRPHGNQIHKGNFSVISQFSLQAPNRLKMGAQLRKDGHQSDKRRARAQVAKDGHPNCEKSTGQVKMLLISPLDC